MTAAKRKRIALGGGIAAIALVAIFAVRHAASGSEAASHEALAKPVTAVHARKRAFQPTRTYVGTFEPWLSANVGPQLVSAYVQSVDVRPGAAVKRGDLLATLDCREASAASQAVVSEARAIDARQKALAAESARLQELLARNFVSPNEAQQKAAASSAEAAKLDAQRAKAARSSLEVGDCVLRAPFDGEIATRAMDPGGYARPGTAIVTVVDRNTVRYTVDVPEIDFDLVAPGRPVRIAVLATKAELAGVISRRAPAADPSTRTIRVEVDIADSERRIPVGTTGEAHLDVGAPIDATAIPLAAATLRGKKASVFVVDGPIVHARTFDVKGEAGGLVYVDAALADGTELVTEGRALLNDGDHVNAKLEEESTR